MIKTQDGSNEGTHTCGNGGGGRGEEVKIFLRVIRGTDLWFLRHVGG